MNMGLFFVWFGSCCAVGARCISKTSSAVGLFAVTAVQIIGYVDLMDVVQTQRQKSYQHPVARMVIVVSIIAILLCAPVCVLCVYLAGDVTTSPDAMCFRLHFDVIMLHE
jgi:hypothetical protein